MELKRPDIQLSVLLDGAKRQPFGPLGTVNHVVKVVKHNVLQLPRSGNKRAMIYASTSYQVNSAYPVCSLEVCEGDGNCGREMLNRGPPSQVQVMRQMMPPS